MVTFHAKAMPLEGVEPPAEERLVVLPSRDGTAMPGLAHLDHLGVRTARRFLRRSPPGSLPGGIV
jgi:hypothetical protein